MLDGQSIGVDHLVKIIQAFQIGRTTGSLVATRGEGDNNEVGRLVFLNGQVVQAKVGRREGREAFNWLTTWGKCHYTFIFSTATERVTGSLPEIDTNPLIQEEEEASQGDAELQETAPQKCKPLEYSLQLIAKKSLSRMHRNVFLLVDGSRKVEDLMRLLKLNETEVLILLHDLQNAGVISLSMPLSV